MKSSLLRTKPMNRMISDTSVEGHKLRRALTSWDLTAIGIGCIIGVGIFVLPGVQAANNAGPGIILSSPSPPSLALAAPCATRNSRP